MTTEATQAAPPASWPGSKPEYYVNQALIQLGFKPGLDFTYQSALAGGRLEYGGAVLDFVIPSLRLAINVQSVYYHYADPDSQRRDAMVRAIAAGQGLRLIYMDEEDVLRNPLYYTQEALAGRDHSLMQEV